MSDSQGKPKLSLLFNKKRTKGEKRSVSEIEESPAKTIAVGGGFGIFILLNRLIE